MINAIDICCGGGGWACAARGLPIRMVAAVDLWQPACQTYRLNHPQTCVIEGDLRVPAVPEQIVGIAKGLTNLLVLGGIPCEWLSSCRSLQKVKAVELAAQRETLDVCLSIVGELSPRWWCLEDVPAIVKHLPILTPYQAIDARDYSPQRRKRVYVGDFPPPKLGRNKEVMRDRLLPGPYRIGRRLQGRTPRTSRAFSSQTTLAAFPDRKSPTVLKMGSQRDAEVAVIDDALPGGMRNFEWQELARMQGFPTDYLFYGSPTDVSAMVGRAVQIDLGREILRGICGQYTSSDKTVAARLHL